MPISRTINRSLTRQNGPTVDRPYIKSTINYTITATIPDDASRVDCTIYVNSVDYFFDPDAGATGYINIHTLAIGVPYLEPKGYTNFGYNNWDVSWGQVLDYYSAYPAFESNLVWGIAGSDQNHSFDRTWGLTTGQSRSWTRPLTASDWNADGTLKDIVLVGNAQRGINTGGLPVPANLPVVHSDLSDSISIGDFDWSYFPMAIRLNGDWESFNRPGGSLQIRENGGWRDMRNSLTVANADTVHIRKNGVWERAALTGNNG